MPGCSHNKARVAPSGVAGESTSSTSSLQHAAAHGAAQEEGNANARHLLEDDAGVRPENQALKDQEQTAAAVAPANARTARRSSWGAGQPSSAPVNARAAHRSNWVAPQAAGQPSSAPANAGAARRSTWVAPQAAGQPSSAPANAGVAPLAGPNTVQRFDQGFTRTRTETTMIVDSQGDTIITHTDGRVDGYTKDGAYFQED